MLIELTIMAGRSIDARKQLVRSLFTHLEADVGIVKQDVEIVILEAPAENWGFRGLHGDEAVLPYSLKV
jgi:phenylpyruvate tautomerase PptA (4-oxalocrotonate tautomerase family)